MKKLIVISLVLAAVSVANAGVDWAATYDDGTKTVTVELIGTDILQFILSNSGAAITADVDGTWGALYINPGFSEFASSAGIPDGRSINFVYGMADLVAPPVLGVLWSAQYTLDQPPADFVSFDVADAAFAKTVDATYAIGDVTAVPEPLSIVFLGLGGLFLRRRKPV